MCIRDRLTDKPVVELYRNFGYRKLRSITEVFKPDVIINTFPILASLKLKNDQGKNIPVFNVVTDYYAHTLWISKEIDKFYICLLYTSDSKNSLYIFPPKYYIR